MEKLFVERDPILALNNLDVGNITDQVTTWSTNHVALTGGAQIGDFPNQIQTGDSVVIGGTVTNIPNNLYYPYYPYTWITYNTADSNFNKVLVTKAENGFVLVYNNKTYIAKNENEVAKIIVKVTKPEEK